MADDRLSERTKLEMQKGAAMVERHDRLELLEKWCQERKVSHEFRMPDMHIITVGPFVQDGTVRFRGAKISRSNIVFEEEDNWHYPSEGLIARLYLALEFAAREYGFEVKGATGPIGQTGYTGPRNARYVY